MRRAASSSQAPQPRCAVQEPVATCLVLDQQTALRIVRREAELRQSEDYIGKTRPFVLAGRAPPVEFDQEVQGKALVEHGFPLDEPTIRTYQELVSSMPLEMRQNVFFLKANDKLFHPEVDPTGMTLRGELVSLSCGADFMENWLAIAGDRGCDWLFVAASTST